MILKHPEREDRNSSLTVVLTYTVGQPRNQQVLHMQLTDESDLFLLYTLDISEDDFHLLKTEQSILVDFATFPSKLVELLRHCQSAADEEHPRFVAQMSSMTGVPTFTVTETNPFRQLAHLALRCVSGNDSSIKKYLASRLIDCKTKLSITLEELAQRTEQLQVSPLAHPFTRPPSSLLRPSIRLTHPLSAIMLVILPPRQGIQCQLTALTDSGSLTAVDALWLHGPVDVPAKTCPISHLCLESIWQETASLASQQSERLRTVDEEHSRYVSAVKVQHAGEMAEAKERAVAMQHDQSLKNEHERAGLIEKHSAEITTAKHGQATAESRAAQLTAAQHELQLQASCAEYLRTLATCRVTVVADSPARKVSVQWSPLSSL